jgi:hypothetical protein
MECVSSVAKVCTVIFIVFAWITGSAAQTIRYEEDGRQHIFDFKKSRQDKPGTISGVPGVLENAATSLPENRSRPARQNEGSERRARSQKPAGSETVQRTPKAPARQRQIEEEPSHSGRGNPEAKVTGSIAPTNATSKKQDQTPHGSDDDAQARARLIEQFKASALAEEQRRLQAERNRDRHIRTSGTPLTHSEPTRAAQAEAEADPTGTVSAFAENGSSTSETPAWKRSVCRLLFFGVLPGC